MTTPFDALIGKTFIHRRTGVQRTLRSVERSFGRLYALDLGGATACNSTLEWFVLDWKHEDEAFFKGIIGKSFRFREVDFTVKDVEFTSQGDWKIRATDGDIYLAVDREDWETDTESEKDFFQSIVGKPFRTDWSKFTINSVEWDEIDLDWRADATTFDGRIITRYYEDRSQFERETTPCAPDEDFFKSLVGKTVKAHPGYSHVIKSIDYINGEWVAQCEDEDGSPYPQWYGDSRELFEGMAKVVNPDEDFFKSLVGKCFKTTWGTKFKVNSVESTGSFWKAKVSNIVNGYSFEQCYSSRESFESQVNPIDPDSNLLTRGTRVTLIQRRFEFETKITGQFRYFAPDGVNIDGTTYDIADGDTFIKED